MKIWEFENLIPGTDVFVQVSQTGPHSWGYRLSNTKHRTLKAGEYIRPTYALSHAVVAQAAFREYERETDR